MGFFSNWRKSKTKSLSLQEVSKSLGGQPNSTSIMAMMQAEEQQNTALDTLFGLIETDSKLASILSHYGADRNSLSLSYRALLVCGAGQWANGHWVPASGLAFATTLPYILEKTANGTINSRDVWMDVSWRLIDYFGSGQLGLLSE